MGGCDMINDELCSRFIRLFHLSFSDKQKKGLNIASPKAEYVLAAELGYTSKSEEICGARYATCPFNGRQMMTALRESEI